MGSLERPGHGTINSYQWHQSEPCTKTQNSPEIKIWLIAFPTLF